MNGTPRLRSAFPDTPPPSRRRNAAASKYGASPGSAAVTPKANGGPLQRAPSSNADARPSEPFIPFETLDAANQRFYVASFYLALWAWRLYDFYNLVLDDTESLWLFMKWISIDGVFLFGLPALRIPWLEWSSATMAVLFIVHAMLDGMLMFKIGIPLTSWFIALSKLIYNYETAISERKVKPDSLVNNASLILGRQIIHILPEGSAMLNPEGKSFCLDSTRLQAHLPIQINQTSPVSIELLRIDLDSQEEEIIVIKQSEAKSMKKLALRDLRNGARDGPLTLDYVVKKTGYYVLHKVLDESKLEVQPRRSHAVVASCPKARFRPTPEDRCFEDLSNIAMEVTGTPPLQVKWRRTVNGVPVSDDTRQGLSPADFESPLGRSRSLGALTKNGHLDVSYLQSRTAVIAQNETLAERGLSETSYEIEWVQDALGNNVSYSRLFDENEAQKIQTQGLRAGLMVHGRPQVLVSTQTQQILQVARGHKTNLPLQLHWDGKADDGAEVTVQYHFTPEQDITTDGSQSPNAQPRQFTLGKSVRSIQIQEPGLYSLHSVSSNYCGGSVREPSAVILQNPPEPDLSVTVEDITDRCANRPIGKKVYLDLIGTPPFTVTYRVRREGAKHDEIRHETVNGHKGVLTLQPREAGTYSWHFISVADRIYQGHPVEHKNLRVQQDVKPPPNALFGNRPRVTAGCIDESVAFPVSLWGEGPWELEYELVRAGKRSKHRMGGISEKIVTLTTDKLAVGGEYILGLTSVTDSSGCTELLKDEALINVRHQRPQASFGALDGKFSVRALEGKSVQLPLRLTGEGPWEIFYRAPGAQDDKRAYTNSRNGFLEVIAPGEYTLQSVRDSSCPGTVDKAADRFQVSWLGRPQLHITESDFLKSPRKNEYVKEAVCEGDEDALDISFSGSPPYKIAYEEHRRPMSGQKSMRKRDLSGAVGIASVRMDTSQAGSYEYRFTELSDNNYDHERKRHENVLVKQEVHPRPSAKFASPGKTYSYCATDGEETSDLVETIPVKLSGKPPFNLEVELRHSSAAKPEIISLPNIPSNTYDIRLSHRHLHLGSSTLTIRKVRDSRGCQSLPQVAPVSSRQKNQQERVLLAVHSAPGITPLEGQTHYCVGDRISFSLIGQPPFNVFYDFVGAKSEQRKAHSHETTFRRLAEKPGVFTITAISDSASSCRAPVSDPVAAGVQKHIHPLPAVRVSKGKDSRVDIHEGGEVDILFEFEGTPPFEFTWTRSELDDKKTGKKGAVLETRTATSEGHSLRIKASEEGSYEVIAARDKWCGVSKSGSGRVGRGDKLLTY